VDSGRHARAEATAAIVLDAAHSGRSLCIPGTRETGVRVTRPAAGAIDSPAAAAVLARAASVGVEQRENERSGGGAPSERDTTRSATIFEWLRGFLR
jgi:hypothetical protein